MKPTTMKTNIKRWLQPPIFEGDEAKTRRASLLNTISILILLYLNVVIAANLIGGRIPISVTLLDILLVLVILLMRSFLWRGNITLVGGVMAILGFLLITVVNAMLGTIRTPTTATYLFVVILAGLLFDWPGILVTTIASSLAVMGLILAENAGLLPQPDYTVTFTQWFSYTGLFGITGSLSFFALQSTRIALVRAEQELNKRTRVQDALQTSQSYLQAITNSTQQSFVLMDRNALILSFNRIAARNEIAMFGLEMHTGDSMFRFVRDQDRAQFTDDFASALAGETITGEKSFHSPSGQEHWFSFAYNPAHTETGSIMGVCFNTNDITERKLVEAALIESEERYRIIMAVLNSGMLLQQADGSIQAWNLGAERILGLNAAEIQGLTSIDPRWRAVHEDGTPFPGEDHPAMVTLRTGQPCTNVVMGVHTPDGRLTWIIISSQPLFRPAEALPHAAVTSFTDITERKQIGDALHQSEVRFRALFEQTHDAVFLLDMEGGHLAANQRSADMLGYTLEEMKLLSVREISAELDQSLNINARLVGGEQIPMYERLFRKKNGQIFPVEISVELVRDTNGNPMHIQSVMRDISQRKQAEAALKMANDQLQARVAEVEQLQVELREQALRDPLSGLYNRRYLNEALAREIQRTVRDGEVISIILMDVDHFKTINDTYGHPVGDSVLIEIARLITKQSRSSDIICRYGGEEFLMVLPGVTPDLAAKRADDIRQTCAETIIQHAGENLGVTLSFGVAAYPEHGQTMEQIIANADFALYTSKQTGRNRVTIWASLA